MLSVPQGGYSYPWAVDLNFTFMAYLHVLYALLVDTSRKVLCCKEILVVSDVDVLTFTLSGDRSSPGRETVVRLMYVNGTRIVYSAILHIYASKV